MSNCCQPGGSRDGSSVSDDEGEDGFSGTDGAASDGLLGDLVESWPASDGVLSAGGVPGDGFSGSAGGRRDSLSDSDDAASENSNCCEVRRDSSASDDSSASVNRLEYQRLEYHGTTFGGDLGELEICSVVQDWMLLVSLANRIRLEGGVVTSSCILSAGGDGFFGSVGFRSLNMNSTSSETLSSITWGSTKTTAGRMLRK